MARFDSGVTLTADDHARLTGQILDVFRVLSDFRWHTLDDVAKRSGAPAASASAQIRNLRKARFGGHVLDRRHVGNGLYEYRLVPAKKPEVFVQVPFFGEGATR